MASGWANDGAVQEQIDSTIEDAIARARSQLPRGESLTHCEECDATIPEARRRAIPGVPRPSTTGNRRSSAATTAAAARTASCAEGLPQFSR